MTFPVDNMYACMCTGEDMCTGDQSKYVCTDMYGWVLVYVCVLVCGCVYWCMYRCGVLVVA